MSSMHAHRISLFSLLLPVLVSCQAASQFTLPDGGGAAFPAPDGIDPKNPNIERSTQIVDFDGIRTIRIEIPTGRVAVSQSNGSSSASLKVTKVIVVEGLSHEVLAGLLRSTTVTAERSFVDDTRLDIETTLAAGVADSDVAVDVRLAIPNGANVEIFLNNGAVDVVGVTGNVEIRTANGAVLADHIQGNVVAHTSNRPIQAIDVIGNVQAETRDGDITLRLAPPAGGQVTATTTNGSIDLIISETTAANLSLVATDGVVSANLAGFAISDIETGSGLLRSVLNGGGTGHIEAQTTGDEIRFAGM